MTYACLITCTGAIRLKAFRQHLALFRKFILNGQVIFVYGPNVGRSRTACNVGDLEDQFLITATFTIQGNVKRYFTCGGTSWDGNSGVAETINDGWIPTDQINGDLRIVHVMRIHQYQWKF